MTHHVFIEKEAGTDLDLFQVPSNLETISTWDLQGALVSSCMSQLCLQHTVLVYQVAAIVKYLNS